MHDSELAVRLVTEAGTLALRMRADGLTAERKTSAADLVTAADRAAEQLIGDELRRARPDDGLLGEEGAARTSTSGRRWVIDPIDGTSNFHAGLDYWCSALALEDNQGLLLGAVHQPASAETFIGGRDLPTMLQGQRLPPLTDRPLSECIVATYLDPASLADPEISDVLHAVVANAATPRILGSGTWDLANVAAGRIGVWVQHDCPAWDWLPGKALVDGVDGRTDVVEAHGHRWYLAGNHQAVAEAIELLQNAR
jgi:fructose-1,6-bisphosphatase/inositol monophosphatase family enzyme